MIFVSLSPFNSGFFCYANLQNKQTNKKNHFIHITFHQRTVFSQSFNTFKLRNWINSGFLFAQSTTSINQLSVIVSFIMASPEEKERKERNPLESSPVFSAHTLTVQGFSNWGRYDNTCYSVTLCVCGQCRNPPAPPIPPLTHTKSPNKKNQPCVR